MWFAVDCLVLLGDLRMIGEVIVGILLLSYVEVFYIYGVCSAGVGEVGVMRLSTYKAGLKGAGFMVVVMCIGTVG